MPWNMPLPPPVTRWITKTACLMSAPAGKSGLAGHSVNITANYPSSFTAAGPAKKPRKQKAVLNQISP
ncbi:MAG: hypothetical protein ACK55Z_28095, partial [bacterium]